MKEHVKRTMRPEVMGGLGGFSGAFSLEKIKEMEKPVLLSGTDGVGTKLKIAFLTGKHNTVGIDCVAMCVNDVACAGGEPLYFLDYIACGKNVPEKIADIVSGVCEGCIQAGAALIGGETAEMPGFYPEDEYDLAGFAVGAADEKDIITGKDIKPGDKLVGIASSGVHSNGFSLVRKIFDVNETNLKRFYPELGATLGEVLLTPTKIYVKALRAVKDAGITIKGCSHITGGGFYENIPRMLPDGIVARVRKDSYPILPIFTLMQKKGEIAEQMMYNTFNMGIGMVLALDSADARRAVRKLKCDGGTVLVDGPLLGDNILLVGNQLVSHCAGAFGRGQPFRLHRLHLASAQRTVLRGIVAHLRCLHAVCGEARLEGAVAHRADDKSTATLHLVAARILHRESRRHDDAAKAVVFGLGNVQRGNVGNLVAVLVNELQGKITLCLNGKGCEKPQA